jgi:hypothetical protein
VLYSTPMMHLDAPLLTLNPAPFDEALDSVKTGTNQVRFCDDDVQFLTCCGRGPIAVFAVHQSPLGTLCASYSSKVSCYS